MNRSLLCRIATAFALLAFPLAGAEVQRFGKPLQGLPKRTLEGVLAEPEAGKLVRVEGTIDTVCKNKGCWLELKQGDKSVHVTFEGYSFFVPKTRWGRPASSRAACW